MRVEFSDEALDQIAKLDKPIRKRIFDYMARVAALDDPRSRGEKLYHNLKDLWRYRVGDYRILCRIVDAQLVVTVC